MNILVSRSRHNFEISSSRIAALVFAICALLLVGSVSAAVGTGNYLPNVTLQDQHNQSVSLASLRGKPVLVGFIHTMCKGPCEMLTAKMQSVASAIPAAQSKGVTMLLITTDPADDQPPQLLAYAKKQSLAGNNWILATGPRASIRSVMHVYGVSPEEGDDDAMIHVMKLFLIAPNGTLAHTYSGLNASPQTVAEDIVKLAHQEHAAASQRSGSLQ